jgi:hypothetical protein
MTVSGLPARSYRADVYLSEQDGGTLVVWRSTFEPLVPGTGRVMRAILAKLVRGFAVRVCRYADRLATTGN